MFLNISPLQKYFLFSATLPRLNQDAYKKPSVFPLMNPQEGWNKMGVRARSPCQMLRLPAWLGALVAALGARHPALQLAWPCPHSLREGLVGSWLVSLVCLVVISPSVG